MHRRPRFTRSLGAFDTRRTPVLRTDVLVIGGGIAGLTAALHADTGYARVVVPLANANDILLNPVYRKRVEIVQVKGILEVLDDVMAGKGRDRVLREVLDAGATGGSTVRIATRG